MLLRYLISCEMLKKKLIGRVGRQTNAIYGHKKSSFNQETHRTGTFLQGQDATRFHRGYDVIMAAVTSSWRP